MTSACALPTLLTLNVASNAWPCLWLCGDELVVLHTLSTTILSTTMPMLLQCGMKRRTTSIVHAYYCVLGFNQTHVSCVPLTWPRLLFRDVYCAVHCAVSKRGCRSTASQDHLNMARPRQTTVLSHCATQLPVGDVCPEIRDR